MKYLDKTEQEWIDYIQALTVDSSIKKLVHKLFPKAQFSFSEEDENYGTLVLVNKPPVKTFDDALFVYKTEELTRVGNIFKEMNKKKLYIDKIKEWKHFPTCVSAVTGEANGKVTLKKLIKNEDYATLDLIDTKDSEMEIGFLAEKEQDNTWKAAKTRLKNLDLETVTDPIIKDLLIVLRRE